MESVEPRLLFAAGDLDDTFSFNGKATVDLLSRTNRPGGVAIQLDGKILIAGTADTTTTDDIALVRLNSDGTLDRSFGPGGDEGDGKILKDIAGFDEQVTSLVLQRDGKILVAGQTTVMLNTQGFVARFNKNGTIDDSFDGDGIALVDFGVDGAIINDIAIQDNGSIVMTGRAPLSSSSDGGIALARLTKFGTPDFTFLGNGYGYYNAGSKLDSGNAIVVQPDGKIVVAGIGDDKSRASGNANPVAMRFKSDGSLDEDFSADGKSFLTPNLSTAEANDLALLPSGQIAVVGNLNGYDARIWLLTPDGEVIDDAPSIEREFETDFFSVVALPDNSLIATGIDNEKYVSGVLIHKYTATQDELIDNESVFSERTFFSQKDVYDQGEDAVVQPDGNIVVVGSHDFPNGLGPPDSPTKEDFGIMRIRGFAETTGSISGRVFKDRDSDGVRDDNDAGHAAVRVYVDKNLNKKLDFSEISVLTDANGRFTLPGLEAGTHRIREIVPKGFRRSSPASYYDVNLSAGENDGGKLFGNTQKAQIRGFVFRDKDGDGMFADSEPGLKNFRVFIDANKNGELDDELSTKTADDGSWAFNNLDAGEYIVRVLKKDGFKATTGVKLKIEVAKGDALHGFIFGQERIT